MPDKVSVPVPSLMSAPWAPGKLLMPPSAMTPLNEESRFLLGPDVVPTVRILPPRLILPPPVPSWIAATVVPAGTLLFVNSCEISNAAPVLIFTPLDVLMLPYPTGGHMPMQLGNCIPNASVPALMVVAPVYVLAPVSVSVPLLALMSEPPVPPARPPSAMTPPNWLSLLLAARLTVSVLLPR